MHLYLCKLVSVCTYVVCNFVYVHICTLHVFMNVNMHECKYVSICECLYIHMYVCVCVLNDTRIEKVLNNLCNVYY